LPAVGSGKTVSLHDFKGKSPVVLVFGSYSCPNLRASAEALEALYAKYGRKIPFLLIYIREAHTQQNWESTRNLRDGISVAPAVTLAEKQEHAVMCSRKLRLRFPAVVDGMQGAVETAYAGWPSRAVIVSMDGQILYSTRLTELDFHANEMELCLKRASAK
jgi:type I thyroxine 5'-deiodinase